MEKYEMNEKALDEKLDAALDMMYKEHELNSMHRPLPENIADMTMKELFTVVNGISDEEVDLAEAEGFEKLSAYHQAVIREIVRKADEMLFVVIHGQMPSLSESLEKYISTPRMRKDGWMYPLGNANDRYRSQLIFLNRDTTCDEIELWPAGV